jgi:hypothetical protein
MSLEGGGGHHAAAVEDGVVPPAGPTKKHGGQTHGAAEGKGGRCRAGCSMMCRVECSPVDNGYGRQSVWRLPGSGDGGTDHRATPAMVKAVSVMVTMATGQAGRRRRRAGGRRWRWHAGDNGDGGWRESTKIVSTGRAQAATRALRYSANLRRPRPGGRRLWLIYVGLYPTVVS